MEKFMSFDGVELAYEDSRGKGFPLILLHGFTTSSCADWTDTGVYPALASSGRRVIMLDLRGHGESAKPHTPHSYCDRAMARDVQALARHLGLYGYDLMGYSMGAKVAVEAALMSECVRRLVLVGFAVYERDWQYSEAERLSRIKNMLSRKRAKGDADRLTAELYHGDRKAFAARLEGALLPEFTCRDLMKIDSPVLVVNGRDDEADARRAASYFRRGSAEAIAGDSRSVLWNRELPGIALAFLGSGEED
jgi:pimeloyl-ACP methyl ester carboxylesterase